MNALANLLPNFSAAGFALGGLALAAGPILIHLLNRRRFRVVDWAAMDFLREALKRNRRIMQLRDLLLLLLRTAAVLLFGLALARPFLSVSEETFDASQPLHAVLLIDNSLSMGYETLEGTLLDLARQRARDFLGELPQGSRISIIPLGGTATPISVDPYRTREDALEALARIELVDRPALLSAAAVKAQRAIEAVPDLAPRVVLLSDQQRHTWRGMNSPEALEKLPAMQVVQVAPPGLAGERENSWISDFRLQDGIADVETPATLVVEVRHEGPAPRTDVPVTLWVDGAEVASKTVHLEPGGAAREVTFSYLFDESAPEPGRAALVPVKVALPPDRLAVDNERHLVVPVVASLPVVFIDQYDDAEEDALKGRFGETWHLRRLLAPLVRRDDPARQLVQIRHFKLEGLSAEELRERIADARLVVVAGIADPGDAAVDVLRQYVRQGGQLLLAAGGEFDPLAWNAAAWREGGGILPLPLKPQPLGVLPEEASSDFRWFTLAAESGGLLHHYYFRLAGVAEEELRDLYSEPFFFKAVEVDEEAAARTALEDAERQRIADELELVRRFTERSRTWAEQEARGALGDADRAARDAAQQALAALRPQWLLFANHRRTLADDDALEAGEPAQHIEQLVRRSMPQVLARFDNGAAFLVERSLGEGRVLFASSSLLATWNTLPRTNAMLLMDRILRSMIEATLPQSNFPAADRITLPVEVTDPNMTFVLSRPGADGQSVEQPLLAGFIGAETRGVTIPYPLRRGFYTVSAYAANGPASAARLRLWDVPLAVVGQGDQSELAVLTREQFEEQLAGPTLRWVGPEESISLAGSQIRGQNWWRYLVLAVLALLLVELGMLAAPVIRERMEANGSNGTPPPAPRPSPAQSASSTSVSV